MSAVLLQDLLKWWKGQNRRYKTPYRKKKLHQIFAVWLLCIYCLLLKEPPQFHPMPDSSSPSLSQQISQLRQHLITIHQSFPLLLSLYMVWKGSRVSRKHIFTFQQKICQGKTTDPNPSATCGRGTNCEVDGFLGDTQLLFRKAADGIGSMMFGLGKSAHKNPSTSWLKCQVAPQVLASKTAESDWISEGVAYSLVASLKLIQNIHIMLRFSIIIWKGF